ncbi:MAG: FAD-dependent oxidoreductase, partial [Phycisphaerae bacterium]
LACRNTDEADLARTARVTASSEQSGCAAANVTNGISRAVGSASNQWRSQPIRSDGPGEYIELSWPQAQTLACVQITFDTGFQRPLTLTHEDRYNARMIRGPQPECVRDYELLVRDGQGWRPVTRVTGNYQRRRVHEFAPIRTEAIRLVVQTTNGDPAARVYEIRAYAG